MENAMDGVDSEEEQAELRAKENHNNMCESAKNMMDIMMKMPNRTATAQPLPERQKPKSGYQKKTREIVSFGQMVQRGQMDNY